MRPFKFRGTIPASKSLMNRALIVQSYEPSLRLLGDSRCEDVVHLRKSLKDFRRKKVFDCGEGGTTLRFLAFRVSREKGNFFLKGSPRLLSRPQAEIKNILSQLSVSVTFEKTGLRIVSEGWRAPKKALQIDVKDSSQFLSAVFLNSWNLDFDLEIKTKGKITSESYFAMTMQMLKKLGLRFRKTAGGFLIPRGQTVTSSRYRVESDLSSTFSVAAMAAAFGAADFKDFPHPSLQPDQVFVSLLKQMKVPVHLQKNHLKVQKPQKLRSIRVNLQNSPDLFPVLAVLCAFAEGLSVLYGAPQLVKKESDRIAKTAELLKLVGISCKPRRDGMEIMGGVPFASKSFSFDPDSDHRLAMAAALLKFAGIKIKIKNPQVVKKSFPEFWQYVGVRP